MSDAMREKIYTCNFFLRKIKVKEEKLGGLKQKGRNGI